MRDYGEQTTPCPRCGESVYRRANRCARCGSNLMWDNEARTRFIDTRFVTHSKGGRRPQRLLLFVVALLVLVLVAGGAWFYLETSGPNSSPATTGGSSRSPAPTR
jgi:hypothetical protein